MRERDIGLLPGAYEWGFVPLHLYVCEREGGGGEGEGEG